MIFQGPHERMARNREDLARLVEQTLWHEIAHHFGRNEQEVRAAERLRKCGVFGLIEADIDYTVCGPTSVHVLPLRVSS
jgi:hypothetical protein